MVKYNVNEYLFHKLVSLCNIEGLVRKGNNYNGRCPICGDSKLNKRKKRFYILHKQNMITVFCFNCGADISFINFLKIYIPSVYSEYKKEQFREGNIRKKIFNQIEIKTNSYNSLKNAVQKAANNSLLNDLDELNDDALKWCHDRKFPKDFISTLRYSDNFTKFIIDHSLKEDTKLEIKNDRKVIIPFFDENDSLSYLQGRSIDPVDDKYRYMTITINSDAYKIWGLNKVDKNKDIRILEGVFDACFVNNSLAMASSSTGLPFLAQKFDPKNLTLMLDNDLSINKELKIIAMKAINLGMKIFFFPKKIKEKDINDMIKSGYTTDYIERMIIRNTFSKIEAKVRLKI